MAKRVLIIDIANGQTSILTVMSDAPDLVRVVQVDEYHVESNESTVTRQMARETIAYCQERPEKYTVKEAYS